MGSKKGKARGAPKERILFSHSQDMPPGMLITELVLRHWYTEEYGQGHVGSHHGSDTNHPAGGAAPPLPTTEAAGTAASEGQKEETEAMVEPSPGSLGATPQDGRRLLKQEEFSWHDDFDENDDIPGFRPSETEPSAKTLGLTSTASASPSRTTPRRRRPSQSCQSFRMNRKKGT